jgi:hypothetical protein
MVYVTGGDDGVDRGDRVRTLNGEAARDLIPDHQPRLSETHVSGHIFEKLVFLLSFFPPFSPATAPNDFSVF